MPESENSDTTHFKSGVRTLDFTADSFTALPAKECSIEASIKHSDAIFNLQLNCQRTKTGMLRPVGTQKIKESKLRVKMTADLQPHSNTLHCLYRNLWGPEQRKRRCENWLHGGDRDFNNQSTFVNPFDTRILKKSIIGANSTPSRLTQCSFRRIVLISDVGRSIWPPHTTSTPIQTLFWKISETLFVGWEHSFLS